MLLRLTPPDLHTGRTPGQHRRITLIVTTSNAPIAA